jgi:tetratricopeptide (TPR) repeat protein
MHPDTASSLNNLGTLYRVTGKYADALPLYQRALAIRETVLGPMHPDTASSLNNFAALYDSMGNYAAALPLYQRTLTIRETVLGPLHPSTRTTQINLDRLRAALKGLNPTFASYRA